MYYNLFSWERWDCLCVKSTNIPAPTEVSSARYTTGCYGALAMVLARNMLDSSLQHVLNYFTTVYFLGKVGLALCNKFQPSCTIWAFCYYTTRVCLGRYADGCYRSSAMGLTNNKLDSTLQNMLN